MSNIQTIKATVTSKPVDRGGFYTFDIETTEGRALKATIDGIRLPDPSILQEGTAYIMKGSNPKTGKGDRFSVWEFASPGSEEAKSENLQAYCESKLPELSTEQLGSYFDDKARQAWEEFESDENGKPLNYRDRTAKAVAEHLATFKKAKAGRIVYGTRYALAPDYLRKRVLSRPVEQIDRICKWALWFWVRLPNGNGEDLELIQKLANRDRWPDWANAYVDTDEARRLKEVHERDWPGEGDNSKKEELDALWASFHGKAN